MKKLLLPIALLLATPACSYEPKSGGEAAALSAGEAAGGFACSLATGGLCAVPLIVFAIGNAAYQADERAQERREQEERLALTAQPVAW